ncbi:MAG: hypothetical protein K6E38_01880 [Fretibacterium sp.]|nr:hypothetical protein [Fretibacterium sp.]
MAALNLGRTGGAGGLLPLGLNLGNARSVLQGEAPGSVRFLAAALLALGVWAGVSLVTDQIGAAGTALAVQEGRWRTLSMLAAEYRVMAPAAGARTADGDVDVASVFAQVSERMGLGSRVNRISPDGRNQSVEINRLYAGELTELQKQLAARGVHFLSAEIRALPAGGERLFTVSAIIGPAGRSLRGEARR